MDERGGGQPLAIQLGEQLADRRRFGRPRQPGDLAFVSRDAVEAGPEPDDDDLGAELAEGRGQLIGLPADARVQLLKWPQVEREFPRHFRIATAMMKGPQTIAEIAAGSGSPAEDVADFINANLATGFAEPAPGGGGGLLGRLRGTR